MERRKIQIIAGSTYSISLPKDWIKKHNLKEKNELMIDEKNDGSLGIFPHLREEKELKEISLDVDIYTKNINQILFAVYYLGIETINLYSKTEISKEIKTKIRKTLSNMSGTEISYEDKQRITIKVLLDGLKVDLVQLLYRTSILIDSSLSDILEKVNVKEIILNENEIDRLYHLMTKIISLSLVDSNILNSSNIKDSLLIPSYFLIGKKMENIGDNIRRLGEYLSHNKNNFENKKEILNFLKEEINMGMRHLLKNCPKMFDKKPDSEFEKIAEDILKIKDKTISDYLREILRYVVDIEEEIINICFYKKIILEKNI
jgi:phosphate uptake regulator